MEYTEFKEDISAICSETGLAVGIWSCPTMEALRIMLHWADRIEEEEGVEVDSLINKKRGRLHLVYIKHKGRKRDCKRKKYAIG